MRKLDTPVQTKKLLDESFGENSVKKTTVYTWYKRFHEGRTSPKDNARSGQPNVRDRKVTSIQKMIVEDRRVTVTQYYCQ